MITGQVNEKLEAVIVLPVQGAPAITHQFDAVIDTGFSAFLTLPRTVSETLGLTIESTGLLVLADGSEIQTDICWVTVIWDGQAREVIADVFETEVLVGMGLMKGYELCAGIMPGGPVTLKPLDPAPSLTSQA